MSTPQEQVQCVLWLVELQSLTAVLRRFRMQQGRQLPTRFWDNKLRTTGSLLRVRSPGKTRTSDCDRTFVLGHAGAVCAAQITTSNYPPTRWGAATFLPVC
jgi:hypothetical protein